MSREIKWKKELREVNVCEEGDWVCDNCGKHLDIKKQKRGTYYSILSGHNEWGNDSRDSIEDLDACCDACLIALVKRWLKKWENYPTAYIEINRELFFDLLKEEPNGQ